MTSSTPPLAEESTPKDRIDAPMISVIIGAIEGADLDAALATVRRQSYEGIAGISVVGLPPQQVPEGVESAESLESAISAAGNEVDYFWLLHSDARPRPDALGALVTEVGRNEASLGGSKLLVAGSPDVLESIGSATDIFGEPHSGLDEGEIDLEQYDVVREVAFVTSASMLVRRDLAQGLSGLDDRLPPGAAGLDLSQRVRLAGGRVITVPSSEVYHQGRCEHRGRGWREQAGRLRAMLKAYSVLTLAWVIPYSLLVAVVDSIASLLLLRWRPLARHVVSWGWNLFHLPSTITARRRFKTVRAVGDEELFRFQSRGSVHLREIGSELTDRVLSVFDEDRALARGTRRVWASPGIWGAVIGAILAVFAARAILLSGVPNTGFSFPFEAPSLSMERFFGGWNESGLGSGSPVHPSTAFSGWVSFLWFGNEAEARTAVTFAFALLAVIGMGRLAGRLGFRGPGRYLAGIVLIAGPGTAVLAGAGSWIGLAAAAVSPWAVRSVFLHQSDLAKSRWVQAALVVVWTTLLGSLSPLLAPLPLIAAVVWWIVGGRDGKPLLVAISILGGVVGLAFVLGDLGWVTDSERRIGMEIEDFWPLLIGATALPLLVLDARHRRLAMLGAVPALTAIAATRFSLGGPGLEEAVLVLASFGAAVVTAAVLDVAPKSAGAWLSALAGVAILVLSVGALSGGRLGLPQGDLNARLGFAVALAPDPGPGRVMLVSSDRDLIPGEARSGPGYWYRPVDGAGMTLDEVWLPSALPGDDELDRAMRRISTGVELRPGALLAPFALDWVVIDGPRTPLDEALGAQLDLIPTPLETGARVFENPDSIPLAETSADLAWGRSNTGFAGGGSTSDRVMIAQNHDSGWGPDAERDDWAMTVSAQDGVASYQDDGLSLYLPIAATALFALALLGLIVGRLRR